MDGLHGTVSDSVPTLDGFFPSLAPVADCRPSTDGLIERRLDDLQTLVVSKTRAGFDRPMVEALRLIVRDAAAGRLGGLKFLAFDFCHHSQGHAGGAEGFPALVAEVANLILKAPIVAVACARAHMEGADLEFALACSMLVGERGAQFSFADDPLSATGIYGFLAQKLGFVAAERLMEGAEVLGADEMRALLLLKDVAEPGDGVAALEQFLRRTARRHNSCYGIYRAQRITAPALEHRSGAYS